MMTTDLTHPDLTHRRLKEVSLFLTDYATTLLACGATTLRIEKNTDRIAAAYDMNVEITVLPRHVILTVWDADRMHSYSNVGKMRESAINFYTTTFLSRLSWQIVEQGLPLAEARSRYDDIVATPRIDHRWVLLLVGLANAAFCRLFGGDAASMAIVFVATVDGFYLKTKLLAWHWDARWVTILAGCVSAVIACSGYVFDWGATHDLALGTSVLYLVPGIPLINSVSDLIHGHHICCLSRFIQAAVTTICLSLGLCLALLLMNISYF